MMTFDLDAEVRPITAFGDTVTQMIALTYDRLTLPQLSNSDVTEVKVVRALMEAHRQWSKDTECYTRQVSVIAQDSLPLYQLPSDVYRIVTASVYFNETALLETSLAALNAQAGEWRATAFGTPTHFLRVGNNLYLYPTPAFADNSEAVVPLTYDAIILPSPLPDAGCIPELTASTNTVDLPVAFTDAIVAFAVFRLGNGYASRDPFAKEAAANALAEYRIAVSEQRGVMISVGNYSET